MNETLVQWIWILVALLIVAVVVALNLWAELRETRREREVLRGMAQSAAKVAEMQRARANEATEGWRQCVANDAREAAEIGRRIVSISGQPADALVAQKDRAPNTDTLSGDVFLTMGRQAGILAARVAELESELAALRAQAVIRGAGGRWQKAAS